MDIMDIVLYSQSNEYIRLAVAADILTAASIVTTAVLRWIDFTKLWGIVSGYFRKYNATSNSLHTATWDVRPDRAEYSEHCRRGVQPFPYAVWCYFRSVGGEVVSKNIAIEAKVERIDDELKVVSLSVRMYSSNLELYTSVWSINVNISRFDKRPIMRHSLSGEAVREVLLPITGRTIDNDPMDFLNSYLFPVSREWRNFLEHWLYYIGNDVGGPGVYVYGAVHAPSIGTSRTVGGSFVEEEEEEEEEEDLGVDNAAEDDDDDDYYEELIVEYDPVEDVKDSPAVELTEHTILDHIKDSLRNHMEKFRNGEIESLSLPNVERGWEVFTVGGGSFSVTIYTKSGHLSNEERSDDDLGLHRASYINLHKDSDRYPSHFDYDKADNTALPYGPIIRFDGKYYSTITPEGTGKLRDIPGLKEFLVTSANMRHISYEYKNSIRRLAATYEKSAQGALRAVKAATTVDNLQNIVCTHNSLSRECLPILRPISNKYSTAIMMSTIFAGRHNSGSEYYKEMEALNLLDTALHDAATAKYKELTTPSEADTDIASSIVESARQAEARKTMTRRMSRMFEVRRTAEGTVNSDDSTKYGEESK